MDDLTTPPPADDGELLSAYLAGELPDDAVAAVEARLADEDALRGALERQREVQESLAAVRAPDLQAGASHRLRARLAAERGDLPGAVPGAAGTVEEAVRGATLAVEEGAGGAPVSLDAARARRSRLAGVWAGVGTVAAAVVAVTVVGGGLWSGGDQDTMAAGEADSAQEFFDESARTTDDTDGGGAPTEEPVDMAAADDADEPDMTFMTTPDSDVDTAAQDDPTEETGAAPAATLLEPALAEGAVLADQDEAAAQLGQHPEAAGLLGVPVAEARELAAAFTVALRGAAPFSDGTAPDACLDTVTGGAAGVVVPVRVELVTYEAAPALAYVLAASPEGGDVLERVEGWLVEPTTCATRAFLLLPG